MPETPLNAASEWRRFWSLPIAAAFGYSSSVLTTYSMGAFLLPIQHDFGWTRAQVSLGMTIVGLSDAIFSVPVGMMIDRIGPRRLALMGATLMLPAVALLGTATGGSLNWIFLWCLVALAHLGLQATVWTSAVATRFTASRGMAFAVTLSGASAASAAFPVIATWLIGNHGWRSAFALLSAGWMALVFPMLIFFFRGSRDGARFSHPIEAVRTTDSDLRDGLRSADFVKMLIASSLFAFTQIGIIVHFIPIVTDRGALPLAAAATVSLVGIFSIIGRICTGFFLDRFPSQAVGAITLLLPIVGCALLLADGRSAIYRSVAASLFGLTVGSEIDVIAFLAARRFGIEHFGVFNGAMTGALAFGLALGPLAAGALFDRFGSYVEFLILSMILCAISCIAIATVGRRTGRKTPA